MSARLQILRELCQTEPNEPFNFYAYALELIKTDPIQAEAALKLTTQKFPEYLPTFYQYGKLLYEINQLEEAAKVIKTGISLAENQHEQKALQELKNLLLQVELDF